MKVFFAVPDSAVEDICECGLKISEYKNRTVVISGNELNAVSARLNPNDLEQIEGYTVIRLVPDDAHSFISEGSFYDEYVMALQNGGDEVFWKKEYEKSMIPVSQYKLGMYRSPEYLIIRTLFSEQIETFDRRKGEPILYNNSTELYIGNAVRSAEEHCDDFYENAVCAFYEKKPCMKVTVGEEYVFFSDENGEIEFISKK